MIIKSLSEFLHYAKVDYQLYDLGRQLRSITSAEFKRIEQNCCPYPWPLQQHAFLAVVFNNPALSEQHYIWFLKFPLDERGLLHPAAPSHFLESVATILDRDLTAQIPEDQQQRLAQNPAIFKPAEEKLAFLHATLSQKLGQPASQYYADVVRYIERDEGSWQHLGVQGFADYAVRLPSGTALNRLCQRLATLEPQPIASLCLMLEHLELPQPLFAALVVRINAELESSNPDSTRICLLLRAISTSAQQQERRNLIDKLLLSHPDDELLITLAARCFTDLKEPRLLEHYLEQLATPARLEYLFHPLYTELVSLPTLRPLLLPMLHTPPKNQTIAHALSLLRQGCHHD